MKPVPERLGQHEQVSGPCGGIRQQRGGFDDPRHRQAELDLRVADRMAAHHDRARGHHALGAAGQNPLQHRQLQLLVGEADQIQGR